MAGKLELPLDSHTIAGLQRLGTDLVRNKEKRAEFLKDRQAMLASYNLQDVDLSRLDEKVVNLLADPEFSRAIETRDVKGIREFVQQSIGGKPSIVRRGTFDFDFDVEFEVEVVAVAIAVFDFAAARARVPNDAERLRRRQLVAEAFQEVGKKISS